MELLVAAHEKLHCTMEEDFDTKRVMQVKFKPWEPENYDALKKLNLKITELRHEHQSNRVKDDASTISDLNEDLLPGLIGKSDLLIDHIVMQASSV